MEPRRPVSGWLVPVLLCSTLVGGCSFLGLGGSREATPPEDNRLEIAAALLEAEAYARAEGVLRVLASSCENGPRGRQSLLLLAALQLDPRNPAASPDSAAVMAARYLALPDAVASARPLAENLYVLALELGADPGLRPAPEGILGGLSTRFTDCNAPPGEPTGPLVLPVLPREPLAHTVARLRLERGALRDSLGTLRGRNQALETQVAELNAELQRIRRLLRGGVDTMSSPLPGRRR